MTAPTLAAILITIAGSLSGSAATTQWGSPLNLSGADSQISTNGELHYAYNFSTGGLESTTINGVTFQRYGLTASWSSQYIGESQSAVTGIANQTPIQPTSNIWIANTSYHVNYSDVRTSTLDPYSNLSPEWTNLLSRYASSRQTGAQLELVLQNLIIGREYEIQIFINRSDLTNDQVTTIDGITVDRNTTDSNGGLGQYLIGTFIADETSQRFRIAGGNFTFINALQVRDITQVPEASTLLFSVLAIGVLSKRRR